MYTQTTDSMPLVPTRKTLLESRVFFDIETIKCQRPDAHDFFYDKAKPPANTKDKDAWYGSDRQTDAARKALEKTVYDGLFGEIVSICWGHYDSSGAWTEYGATRDDQTPEADVIGEFFKFLNARHVKGPVLVGHNIIGFDIIFVQNRALVLELELPSSPQWPRNVKPWSDNVEDLLMLASGGSKHSMPSMDALAYALGEEDKGDVDGSMVGDLYEIGEYRIIHDYCQSDVRKCRDHWVRFVNSGLLT